MRIKQFAKAFGVSTETVRNYERRGLVQPTRDQAGHRRFEQADVKKLVTALKERGGR